MLTWDYSNLVREITTPALAAFIPSCISNIENKRCSDSELQTVLEAFATLLPKHHTIFRQNESKIRGLCTAILSSSSSNLPERYYSHGHQAAAERLLVLLHHCAPKQGGSDKWSETLSATVDAVHATCDRILRAVHEDWQSVAGVKPSVPAQRILSGELEVESEDAVGLGPWKGVYAGAERVVALLRLLTSHLATGTSATMTVRIGSVSDLLTRLYGVVVPYHGKQEFVKINNQVSKDEREALFAVLPQIHIAAIELSKTIIRRFGSSIVAGSQITIDQLMYVFQAESSNADVRAAIYELLAAILEISGASMGRTEVAEISSILKASCLDLLPIAKDSPTGPDAKTNGQAGGIKQQLGLEGGQITQSHLTGHEDLHHAAQLLLRTALLRIDALPSQLRALVDRTAALTRNQQLLQASVMNPPARRSAGGSAPASLLPILAREFGHTAEVEVLLRPRLPVIGKKSTEQSNETDEDEEEEEEAEDEDAAMEDNEQPEQDQALEDGKVDEAATLDALGHNASLEPSATNPPAENSLFASTESKRKATEEVATDVSAKRPRATPPAAEMSATRIAPVPASSAPTVASYHTATGEIASDDDSDFEIPEIHVGDSSEEEDEEE